MGKEKLSIISRKAVLAVVHLKVQTSRLISIFNVRIMLTIFLRADVFSLSAFSSFPISSNAKYCVDLSLLQKGGFVATQNMLLSVTSLRYRIVQQLFLAVLA